MANATIWVKISQIIAPAFTVEAEAPVLDQGETDENPSPVPRVRRINDNASAVKAPPMTAGSAAGSTTFFRMFDGSFHDPVLDHTGYLSPAELRLIAEWLDIGAQFYNDPFVAPVAN